MDETSAAALRGRGLVVTPGTSKPPDWWAHLGEVATAQASGWMQFRAARRRGGTRGFILSDHADWPGLLEAVKRTGASRVGVAHGYVGVLVRYLREQGLDAWSLDGSLIGRGQRSEAEAALGN
jgi:putative mRNA 3-end processing factor